MHVGDYLQRILPLRVPTDWSHDGPVTFTSGAIRLDGDERSFLQIGNGSAFGRLHVPGYRAIAENGLTGELSLTKDDVLVGGRALVHRGGFSFRNGVDETSFEVEVTDLDAAANAFEVSYSRETVLGMNLGPRAGTHMATIFATTIFGRNAVVAGYPSEDPAAPVDSLQVVYEGPPLGNDERSALLDLLRFLTGFRGYSTFAEFFGHELQPLGFWYQNHGRTQLQSTLQPIDFHPVTGDIQLIAREFPVMLDAMHRLRANTEVAVSATIHHYNDGSVQLYPTLRLRDMAVALAALGVVLLERQPVQTPILAINEFEGRIRPVLDAYDESFAAIDFNTRGRLRRKIERANEASPQEELFAVLRSLNIGLSPKEVTWIRKMRNVVLHSGYHGDEADSVILSQNDQAAQLFANVYSRSLLRMLGYTGRYLDAVSGTETLPLDEAPPYPLLDE
jgi:hypothetical protein